MVTLLHSPRAKSFLLLLLISLVVLAGNVSCTPGGPHLLVIVGGKLDIEAQLLTKMYVLLLQHAGFDVQEKARLGDNDVVFKAITSGQIDLYPEFTATGLAKLGLAATRNNPQRDYQNVKQGYESKYHITWLDVAPLNDTYGICTLKSTASELHVTNLSQLAPLASQLTIATPADGVNDPNALPGLKRTYGITFGKVAVLQGATAEESTFQAVLQGQAQLNVCFTTSPLIAKNDFVLLTDDKNSFPVYSPAPIVRDDILNEAPEIATALNPLAPKLTSDVSIILQAQVASGFSVAQVATNWLESQGLL